MDRYEMKIEFGSDPRNESFARVVVLSPISSYNAKYPNAVMGIPTNPNEPARPILV